MYAGKFLKRIVLLVILTFNFMITANCMAEFSLKQWQYSKNIVLNNAKIGENYRIVLDQDVYHASRKSLADLRLISNNGLEVPYEIFTFKKEVKDKASKSSKIP